MPFRASPRAESPSHQQLYKRSPVSPSIGQRHRSSVTPTRNTFALAVVPAHKQQHGGNSASRPNTNGAAPPEDLVYVADVNPTFSVTAAVRCLTALNDRVMWTAEYDGSLCVRALPKGTPLKDIRGREGTYCTSLLRVPEEDTVWAGFQDGYLHVYNARTAELIKATMAHRGGLHCMTVVDDSVFTGGADWKVHQWSPAERSAELLRTLHGHRGGVRSFDVYDGPTGAVLFSGSDDGTVKAWDPYLPLTPSDSEEANIHTFTGHSRAVLSLVVVAHANQLWSGGEDMTLRVWDMQSLECLSVLRGGHTAPIASLMVVESRVWSADKHGHILLWDITTRSLLQDLADRVPYWGIGEGMILAMEKVQPTTAYKVWTASSNGVLQCWTAETVPIVFDEVPVSRGIFRNGTAAPAAITANGAKAPVADPTASPGHNNTADAVNVSALTATSSSSVVDPVKSPNGNSNGADNSAAVVLNAKVASLQDYVRRLEDDLVDTRRDARLNFEKYRLEVQREVETQQLLAQENDRLRRRVRELEDAAGAPFEHPRRSAEKEKEEGPRRDGGETPAPDVERAAWTAEMDNLRRELDRAQQQLEDALHRPPPSAADVASSKVSSHDKPTTADKPASEGQRRFEREDEPPNLPSVTEDALSGSEALSEAAAPAGRGNAVPSSAPTYSAILSSSVQPNGTWSTHKGAVTHTPLSRHLSGDNWHYLLNEKPYELQTTLNADLCAGLGVAPTQLERVDLQDSSEEGHGGNGGVTIEVDVVHPATVPAAVLQQRLESYRFPGLMKMHADAFTTAKTMPDTAEATILDLQQQLENAEHELQETQRRAVEPSPEPQQPYSNARPALADLQQQQREKEAVAAALSAVEEEKKRLQDHVEALHDEVQDQERTIQQLQAAVAEKDGEAAKARQQAQSAEDKARDTQHQLQDLQAQQQQRQTSPPEKQRDNDDEDDEANFRSPRPRGDDAASPPPVLDGTARKTAAASESGRPTALVAVPLTDEMANAEDPPEEHWRAELEKELADAQQKITQLEADLQRQRQPPYPAKKKEEAPQDDLKQKVAQLEKSKKSLEDHTEDLQKELAKLQQKLAAAAAASPSAVATFPTAAEDALQKLQEDYDALSDYLTNQLKPLVSRLKRERGELQLDKARLLERLAKAEQKKPSSAAAVAPEGPSTVTASSTTPSEAEAAAANDDAAARAAAPPESTDGVVVTPSPSTSRDGSPVAQPASDNSGDSAKAPDRTDDLQEDYDALNAYLHDQLKPMISRLKRARGELQLDLTRAQQELQQALALYDEAAAALDESRVREEKMGEAMEALQRALDAEQRKRASEPPTGRPTEAAQVSGGRSASEQPLAQPEKAEPSTEKGGETTPEPAPAAPTAPLHSEEVVAPEPMDKLVTQNLELSVRLADAEAIITQLHDALANSAAQLEQQQQETQQLLRKIDTFQRTGGNGRGSSEVVASASTSTSESRA